MGDFQVLMRKNGSTSSRPLLRKSTFILDLPDELLVVIFKMVRGQDLNFRSHSLQARDIMNVRLTCHRFCHTSSRLLLHKFCVEMNTKSLSRLDELSRHPTIRQGVRSIQLDLSFYDTEMAEYIYLFYLRRIEHLRAQQRQSENCIFMPEQVAQEIISRGKAILKSLESLTFSKQTDDPENLGYQKILREAHEDYQKRCAEQKRILETGFLYKSLAAAICRMPKATLFKFCDSKTSLGRPRSFYEDKMGENACLIESLVRPYSWDESEVDGAESPPFELLYTLPYILHKAGVIISTLHYDIFDRDTYLGGRPSAEHLRGLNLAVQNLKILQLGRFSESKLWRPSHLTGVQALKSFINMILDTASIEEIEINFEFLCNDPQSAISFSLSPLVIRRKYPNLRSLALTSMGIHLTELEELLSPSNPSLVSLSLNCPRLRSGTWEKALELLRERNLLSFSLKKPFGSECDWLPDLDFEEIFMEIGLGGTTKAERYVQRHCDLNPFDELEDPANFSEGNEW